jgi:dTDP-4-amino-4,6-dideoxygalactose transaminase
LGHHVGDFPIAEQLARECLSLPIFPELLQDETERICEYLISATASDR